MKSPSANIVAALRPVLRPILMLVLVAGVGWIPANAQQVLQVDPQQSVVRLSSGSGASALEIGLARVSGQIVFDSRYSADSSLNLKITTGDAPRAEYVEMTFSSKRSWLTDDGKLVVDGDLSVTRVEHSVTMDPDEAYAGPRYGDPVVHTDTREVTLVFSDLLVVPTGATL